ncbi:MAG TPA: hypothetical protein VGU20_01810 [Stellaceae bacterium]|nr:hypothetical protein [Stellaceae bacterium]
MAAIQDEFGHTPVEFCGTNSAAQAGTPTTRPFTGILKTILKTTPGGVMVGDMGTHRFSVPISPFAKEHRVGALRDGVQAGVRPNPLRLHSWVKKRFKATLNQ